MTVEFSAKAITATKIAKKPRCFFTAKLQPALWFRVILKFNV